MAWQNYITTSLFGRRLGLQELSSNISGSGQSGRKYDVLTGAEDIKKDVTADTTGTYLKPFGVSSLSTANLTGGTTCVVRLDPPIPGVEKTIVWQSTGTAATSVKTWVTCSTGGGETIQSTAGTTFTCVASSVGAVLKLIGVTTSQWATHAATAAGFSFSTTT